MGKTVQLGLRIDEDLNREIEELSTNEGVDKMAWIRRALACFAADERDGIVKGAIEDYIYLVIDEKQLLETTGFSKVPKDISDARQYAIDKIKKGNFK